jgi:hypothetical protein
MLLCRLLAIVYCLECSSFNCVNAVSLLLLGCLLMVEQSLQRHESCQPELTNVCKKRYIVSYSTLSTISAIYDATRRITHYIYHGHSMI